MAELPLFDKDGKSAGTFTVDEKLFGEKIKRRLLHQVVVMYEANRRQGTHCTKTRGEVEGSTRKPWPQKHTGNARAGTVRSPIWRHGGVVFGPRPRDYRQTITANTRRAALDSALLAKILDKEVSVIERLEFPQPKTKFAAAVFRNAGFKRTVLVGYVAGGAEEGPRRAKNRETFLAARNLPDVRLMPVEDLNAYEVLKHKDVLLTKEAVEHLVAERKPKPSEAPKGEGGK
ncbi:MAG: 50S ribosomal protein L4 [Planctomycetes bacterium]|nr:50S ribosomal protein L4 [Planctomycetota bacterium]